MRASAPSGIDGSVTGASVESDIAFERKDTPSHARA
jgi:hypothetical protein